MVRCPFHHLKSHLPWVFSPHMYIFTSCGHFHLARTQDHFLRYGEESSPPCQKSPCMVLLTLCGYFHLTCPLPPDRKLSHMHPNMAANISPSMHLMCSPPCENNIFHVMWKNSQKKHEATPIPPIGYLYEPPIIT